MKRSRALRSALLCAAVLAGCTRDGAREEAGTSRETREMTTAEVMVSVTGLEFAYTQAPRQATCDAAGAASLYASGGEPVEGYIVVARERLKLVVPFTLLTILLLLYMNTRSAFKASTRSGPSAPTRSGAGAPTPRPGPRRARRPAWPSHGRSERQMTRAVL